MEPLFHGMCSSDWCIMLWCIHALFMIEMLSRWNVTIYFSLPVFHWSPVYPMTVLELLMKSVSPIVLFGFPLSDSYQANCSIAWSPKYKIISWLITQVHHLGHLVVSIHWMTGSRWMLSVCYFIHLVYSLLIPCGNHCQKSNLCAWCIPSFRSWI